ncbi:hypothetical protein SMJ63A_70126 [Stenotrophomonas geniculata]
MRANSLIPLLVQDAAAVVARFDSNESAKFIGIRNCRNLEQPNVGTYSPHFHQERVFYVGRISLSLRSFKAALSEVVKRSAVPNQGSKVVSNCVRQMVQPILQPFSSWEKRGATPPHRTDPCLNIGLGKLAIVAPRFVPIHSVELSEQFVRQARDLMHQHAPNYSGACTPRIKRFLVLLACDIYGSFGRLPRCNRHKDCCHCCSPSADRRPSIPPHNATTLTWRPAGIEGTPPAHSVIPLWTSRHSDMARAPEVCRA